jgi:hypothetical protein
LVNHPSIGFEDVEDAVEPEAAQILELSEAQVKNGEKVPLRFVRFQNVNSLHVRFYASCNYSVLPSDISFLMYRFSSSRIKVRKMKLGLMPSKFSVFLSSEFLHCSARPEFKCFYARATKDLSGLKRTEE